MELHHKEAIDIFVERFSGDNTIQAILLGGSLAHGFAKSDSDIDLILIVDSNEFVKRKKENKLAFSIWDICTYENGYVDVKVIDIDFVRKIKERGSDAARYAFKDNKIIYSKINGLQQLLADATQFPDDQQEERRKRFASQILAYKWFYSEALKKENKYLVYLSIQKLVLFASRIILNENRLLYPFHKWMLRELEAAQNKPDGIIEKINDLFDHHSLEKVNSFCDVIFNFIGFTEKTVDWPNYFMKDSEQNWIDHEAPVDDL